jgi:broad specificity phosphatase PhoE
MTLTICKSITSIALGTSLMVGAMIPSLAFAGDKVTVYFTRHAEKQPLLTDAGDGSSLGHVVQPKGEKGAEELNEFGEKRAAELADWFFAKGITSELTHIFSSQKLRTRQTIAAIADDAVYISGDALATIGVMEDYMPGDGIQQFPMDIVANNYEGRLETIDSPSTSVPPTVTALSNLPADSVALVAMHSGTFYKILDGLGINNFIHEDDLPTDEGLFPKGTDGKISTFGDIWKVEIKDGVGEVKWRKNLQFNKYKTAVKYTD